MQQSITFNWYMKIVQRKKCYQKGLHWQAYTNNSPSPAIMQSLTFTSIHRNVHQLRAAFLDLLVINHSQHPSKVIITAHPWILDPPINTFPEAILITSRYYKLSEVFRVSKLRIGYQRMRDPLSFYVTKVSPILNLSDTQKAENCLNGQLQVFVNQYCKQDILGATKTFYLGNIINLHWTELMYFCEKPTKPTLFVFLLTLKWMSCKEQRNWEELEKNAPKPFYFWCQKITSAKLFAVSCMDHLARGHQYRLIYTWPLLLTTISGLKRYKSISGIYSEELS